MKKNILNTEIIDSVLKAEKHAIEQLEDMDKSKVLEAISLISSLKGKIVVSGIGKSAFVAKKFVATLNSTGTSSVFLHAADAMHGDVGIISSEDIIVFISKSGGSKEIVELFNFADSHSIPSIVITNNERSILNQRCTVSILLPIIEEGGKDNIIPTASFVSHMAICDSISIALMEQKGFTSKDFGKLHPRGTLGKQLATVDSIAAKHTKPKVYLEDSLKNVIYIISSHKLGACCVMDSEENIRGIITDGDIRRKLEQYGDITNMKAKDIYTSNAKKIDCKSISKDALDLMGKHNINQLIVVGEEDKYIGMIHIQDLINE